MKEYKKERIELENKYNLMKSSFFEERRLVVTGGIEPFYKKGILISIVIIIVSSNRYYCYHHNYHSTIKMFSLKTLKVFPDFGRLDYPIIHLSAAG